MDNNKTYKRGDRFLIDDVEYMIADIGEKVVLVSLESGTRWADPVKVTHPLSISLEEMKQMINYETDVKGLTRPYPPEKTALELVGQLAFEYSCGDYDGLHGRLIEIRDVLIKESK